jgi:hypothetical protein
LTSAVHSCEADADARDPTRLSSCNGSGSETNLTNSPENEFEPSWATTHRLAFTRLLKTNYDIWTMAEDGSDQQRLTNALGEDSQPAWTPQADIIIFTSRRSGDYEVFGMHADGSEQVDLSLSSPNRDLAANVQPIPGPPTHGPSKLPSRGPIPQSPFKCEYINSGKHLILGTPLADRLNGTGGADVICGGGGNDKIEGLKGDDLIDSGRGRDEVRAGRGSDVVFARDGQKDEVWGGRGNNFVRPDRGLDFVRRARSDGE